MVIDFTDSKYRTEEGTREVTCRSYPLETTRIKKLWEVDTCRGLNAFIIEGELENCLTPNR